MVAAFGAVKIATIGMGDAMEAVASGDAKKLNEAMKNLSPNAQSFIRALDKVHASFVPIRKDIQDAMFANLGKALKNVATAILPTFKDGMVEVSSALNGLALEAARVAQQPFFKQALANSMQSTAKATNTLRSAVAPLAKAIAGLLAVGAPYVNMLAKWVNKQAELAAAYVNSAKGQKSMKAAINTGIGALQQLGGLISAITSALGNLFQASASTGQTFIQIVTEMLNKFNAWADTAKGQKQLKELFTALNSILKATLTIFTAIAKVIIGLSGAFNAVNKATSGFGAYLVLIGGAIGRVLTKVFGFMRSLRGVIRVVSIVGRIVLAVAGVVRGGR